MLIEEIFLYVVPPLLSREKAQIVGVKKKCTIEHKTTFQQDQLLDT